MSRKSSTKTRTPAKPAPAALPIRPLHPDFITDQQIHTAYTARLAGLPVTPITAWAHHPDGTHTATLPNGTHLTHTPGTPVFTAHIPCTQGAHHTVNITTAQHLNAATQAAGQCTHPHGGHRILTLHQAATTAAETQALDVTDLRADNDHQPKEHPQP
ncbi:MULTISPECIES: hypothetical protein [unclassified Streptomyces]|uniref:hypothetical protein n=1 Tax=unclassified Streptomyces TaxID=2593676 RepID=UPI000804A8CA|nr:MULTISPECIES: hypothetical protein [unclassified Streptomyces]MYR75121.1 hypothetical protein [Streptomyces sp. SID4925]SBU97983.1 hypothetical protein YUMDRAFT_05991 [Streptomyces sp. OspMP-M45]